MPEVYVKPNDVWNYYQKHKKRLEDELDVIAEKDNIEVCLTQDNGFPLISIEYESEKQHKVLQKECVISADDCRRVSEKFYSMVEDYADVDLESDEESKVATEVDIEIVSEREFELCEALAKFLTVAMGYDESEAIDVPIDEDFLIPVLDEIEPICADQGFPFYRPMVVENTDGQLEIVGL